MNAPRPTLVVGAIIVDDLNYPSLVLAARRTRPEPLAGLWEFPGGKMERGESPEAAVVREVREELTASIEVGPEMRHKSGSWHISDEYEMRLYFAQVICGAPTPGDSHDELKWLAPTVLSEVDWLPSDANAIAAIQRRLAQWHN